MQLSPWLLDPIRRSAPIYRQVALAAVLVNLFALATSLFSMTVYNRVVPNNAMDSLVVLAIGMGVVLTFDYIIKQLRAHFIDVAGARIDREVGGAIFKQLLDLKMERRRGSTGAFAASLREFETLRDFFASATLVAVVDVPFILLFLVVIALLGGKLVLVPLLMIPLVVGAGLIAQPRLARYTKESVGQGHHKQGVLVETVGALETVKAVGAGPFLAERWSKAVDAHAEVSMRQRAVANTPQTVAGLAQNLSYVGVVIFGVNLIAEGSLTLGGLIACSILAGRAVAPLLGIANILTRLTHTRTAYKELDQLMQSHGETDPDRQYLRRTLLGGIEFAGVTFGYPGSQVHALDDVSFRITPGERVAILGRTGSGKSTIAKLLLGLYGPQAGSVLLDGADVRQLHPNDVRASFGAVPQEVALISGSVRDNIALGRPNIDDSKVLDAAEQTGVHDFIGRIPGGYDLKLADRGEGLSGGQRQAIAIARALAGDPPILVFDEPTSAMDAQSEAALLDRLEAKIGDRTVVIVTHRGSLLRLATRIIVLERGKVVADGPRNQVLQSLAAARAAPARAEAV